jgi:hypothetical protein
MNTTPIVLPDAEALRQQLRALGEELRSKRRLLKLMEAASTARQREAARAALGPTMPRTSARGGGDHEG